MRGQSCPYKTIATGYRFVAKPGDGDGKPKRTLIELAKEFGITTQKMRYRLQTSKVPAPKPALQTMSGLWFEPVAFRAWHKAYLESLDAKA